MNEVHVSTKDKPGDYDAFETAKPGEPIFTVQGGDPLGPLTVMFWAWKARQLARTLDSDKERDFMLRKATAAEEVAWAMREYQKGEVAQPGVRANYADTGPAEAPDLGDKIKERAALISGVGSLNNAVAIAKTVEEILAQMDVHPGAQATILNGIEELRDAAAQIEPRREGERS